MLEFRLRRQRNFQQNQEADEQLGDLLADAQLPRKVMLIPYIPGVSDMLRTIANRYEIPSWFSYSGKLGEGFSGNYKDMQHVSKLRNTVYEAMCSCGNRYVSESYHNLKVRIAEPKGCHSQSALSLHLCIGYAHTLLSNRILPMLQEKHTFRRKVLESLIIQNSPNVLCNQGLSTEISDMWFGCQRRLRAVLADQA